MTDPAPSQGAGANIVADDDSEDTGVDISLEDLYQIGYTREELEASILTRAKKRELYTARRAQLELILQRGLFNLTPETTPTGEQIPLADHLTVTMSDRISHITLPPFTANNPQLWLRSIKGRLLAHKVEEPDLFRRVRMDMPLEIIERIPEVMEPTEENDNFTWFADKVIEAYGKTREQDIRELLNKCSLSDSEGPKRLMTKMIEKAGDAIAPFVVSDLFKQKIPKEVARLLVSLDGEPNAQTKEDLVKIADKAEKLMQFENDCTSPYKSVSAVSATSQNDKSKESKSKNVDKDISDLKSQIGGLKKQLEKALQRIDDLEDGRGRSSRQRERSGSRSRSKSRPRIDYSKPENKGRCRLHILYGDKAYHCKLPCVDSGKPLATKPKRSNDASSSNSNAGQ